MILKFIICLLISKTLAQFDGQFWWLNSKLDKFREPPPQPKFEDLSDLETDQSAKIVFRDDDQLSREEEFEGPKLNRGNLVKDGKSNPAIKFQDKSEIALLDFLCKTENIDIFELKFPDDNFILRDKDRKKTDKIKPEIIKDAMNNNFADISKVTYLTNVVPFKVHKNSPSDSENICNYMKKAECNRIGGVVYVKHRSDNKQQPFETRLVCCILPMRPELENSKIYFPDKSNPNKRCKRSDNVASTAMKQRNALLLRRFGAQTHKLKVTTPNPSHRVVTPSDEYVDPYWNIKNSNFNKPNKQGNSQLSSKYEYDDDYIEDYTVEIPKPGLIGLYSDHGPSKPGWTFPTIRPSYGEPESDEDEPNFGYSPTVDPRIEDRRQTSIPRVNGRPVKQSTYENEQNYDAQTISYLSDPDFHVLEGYKLFNLVRNRSRIHRAGKKTTTERIFESNSNEHVLTAPVDSEYNDDLLDSAQVHKDCGRVLREPSRSYGKGKEIGDAEQGSHPSLAMLVLTKRRHSFLCYATIVHPRAVVTAADCVFGRTGPGEITIIAGAWRLSEEIHEEWQKRMATVHIHSLYRPGDLAHNLALLYWKRPLQLNENVQPACLSEPHVGDDCKFFGWGGYDQAIRKQSRWQRAMVLAPRTCEERVTNRKLPAEAFCASVHTRGSVTGIGGPLICDISGRQSVPGIAVWRDLAVVLLPAQEWLLRTIEDLQLD